MTITKYKKKYQAETIDCILELLRFIYKESNDPYFDLSPTDEKKMMKIIRKKINGKNSTTLIAKIDNKVAGIISGQIIDCFIPSITIGKIGYISAAYVKPQFRQQGIAKQLEQKITEFFRNKGIEYCELNVINGNKPGQHTWQSLGYTTFREHMRKKL